MPDDLNIISRVVSGETEAFRGIVERYQGPVIRMIANLMNDRDGAEDVAQEVFLAAYRNLAAFDPARSAFSTWLFTIARNKGINAARKRRARWTQFNPPDKRGPDDTLVKEEFHQALDRGLAALPANQRAAFVLAEFEELPYQAIAQIEGVGIGTIRSRISRAKEKLRALLGGTKESAS